MNACRFFLGSLLAVPVVLAQTPARAEVREAALSPVVGAYPSCSSARSATFDLGVSFTSISAVRIRWAGGIDLGWWCGDGLICPTWQCDFWEAGLTATIDVPGPGEWRTTIRGSGFSTTSTFQSSLGATWDSILDGQGTVQVYLGCDLSFCMIGQVQPDAFLSSAVLVVEGVVQPDSGACCVGSMCTETADAEACDALRFVCDVAEHLPDSFVGCYGDADGNGSVNAADRGFVSAAIGQTTPELLCTLDMDGNGFINAADRGFIAASIGRCDPLPDWQDGSGLNHGVPDTRFGTATFMGAGTTCGEVACP